MALGLCVCLLLAWLTLSVAQAARLAQDDPGAALRWRPQHGLALAVLAEREAASGQLAGQSEAVEVLARRALAAAPLELRALRVLAWAAEARGDDRRAVDLMARAAARSQRDPASHLWMLRRRLMESNYQAAYAHADTLMRIPAVQSQVASIVVGSALSEPRALEALTASLERGPRWRPVLINRFVRERAPNAAFSILVALKDRGLPVAPEERAAVTSGLLAVDGPEQAYLAWIVLLSEDEQAALGNVYDGGFEQPLRAAPFSWALTRGAAEVSPAPGGDGRSLAVAYARSGRRVLAQQILVLPEGRYRIRMKAMAATAASSERAVWSIACTDAGRQTLAALPNAGGGGAWRDISADFVVPGAGCAAQRLSLTSAGGDYPIRSWFDDIEIERLQAAR